MSPPPIQHFDHDDGLVHDHGWACSERGQMAGDGPAEREEIGHDDGLVHDHGWACGERGQMARAAD